MLIRVTKIRQNVINGTDSNVKAFLDFLGGEDVPVTLELRKGGCDYLTSLLYEGSKGNIENIDNILAIEDGEKLRAELLKWREMESMMWEVVDDD